MKIQFVIVTGIFIVFSGLMFASTGQQNKSADKAIENVRTLQSQSYKDIEKLLEEIGYTSSHWQKGNREVPRIRITRIPQRWQKASATIPVNEKKSIFLRLIGSGILQANEKILLTRNRLHLEAIKVNALQNPWLLELAVKYRVIDKISAAFTQQDLDELFLRVDSIPPSLALAQGAIESGWGTSRFAVEGNSLFGQWDLSGNGIKPKDQRQAIGDYGIARYDSPQASIDAYMINLNTNRAYRELRAKRAALRRDNKPRTGMELVSTLGRYSERGSDYIKELIAIIRYNKLDEADEAYLWVKGEVIINPVF